MVLFTPWALRTSGERAFLPFGTFTSGGVSGVSGVFPNSSSPSEEKSEASSLSAGVITVGDRLAFWGFFRFGVDGLKYSPCLRDDGPIVKFVFPSWNDDVYNRRLN